MHLKKRQAIWLVALAALLPMFSACTDNGAEGMLPGIGLDTEEWNTGEGTDLTPSLDSRLTVDQTLSELTEGVQVTDEGTTLVFAHGATEVLLAVDCDDELELLPLNGYPLTVEPMAQTRGLEGKNLFRIRKALYAPGMPTDETTLKFHRKGLDNSYPEDRIRLVLQANPVGIEGLMTFDTETYTHRFDRYIDNELGAFTLPEGKQLSVEFEEGEDPWLKLERREGKLTVVRRPGAVLGRPGRTGGPDCVPIPGELYRGGILRPLGMGLPGRQRTGTEGGQPERDGRARRIPDGADGPHEQAGSHRTGSRRLRSAEHGGVQPPVRRHGLRVGDVERQPCAEKSLGRTQQNPARTEAQERRDGGRTGRERPDIRGHEESGLPAIRTGRVVRTGGTMECSGHLSRTLQQHPVHRL